MIAEDRDPRRRWQRIVEGYRALREAERRALADATVPERVEMVEALCDFMEEVERMATPSVAQPFREMLRRLHQEDGLAVLESHRGSLDEAYIEAAVRDLAQEAGIPEVSARWIHLKEAIAG